MKNSLQRITITFVLISLIPVGFVIYELSSLNNNEKMVSEAYRNQLDAILYSVNQYTDDVFSSWANKIDILLLRNGQTTSDSATHEKFITEFSLMSSVKEVYLSDLHERHEIYTIGDSAVQTTNEFSKMAWSLASRIKKLNTYQRGGYRKIDALDTLIQGRYIPVYFLLNEEVKNYKLTILLIDLPIFIQNVLAPKMQAVSQGKFVISAFDRRDNSLIYSTEDIHPGETVANEIIKQENLDEVTNKELWLLPGYYLGISLKDATISDLVKERLVTGIIIFAVLFLLLVTGILFLYSNIRKEIILSQAKSEFVSNVSHEIRTPLSLISMYAETLEMNRVPEERKPEYYSIISKETLRLSGIVNRILNFAQMDAGRKKYDFKTLDINPVCAVVANSYSPHLKERGFHFEFLQENGDLRIFGDEASVSEALINLLDNAVKYSHKNKHIIVRTGRENDFAFVEVEDQGIGIARAHQTHIFDQFYRVPTHNVHSTKGTGLGLTLVKKTMLAHKGKVTVQSAPERGSTFRLSFPLPENITETDKYVHS